MLSLGIDIGTSGVRTAVLEGDVLVSSARAEHVAQTGPDVDAEKWWEAVAVCLHVQMSALRETGRDPHDITGMAVDGTSGSMVLTDDNLVSVSPALMYNSKGFNAEAAQIALHAPTSHITQGSNSALARAMRLVSRASAPPAHLLHQADFITAKLLGRGGFTDFNNALKTGFDPVIQCWPGWVKDVINPKLLPEVRAPGSLLGEVDPLCAAQFGLSPQTCVHAGTTDSIAAFLASAPLEEGAAVTSLGSTLAIKILSPVRIDDPAIGLYSHRLGDLWLVGGASNTGGAVLKSFFTDAQLAALSHEIDPDNPTGLAYYPLLSAGERFPVNDPDLEPLLSPRPHSDARFLQGMLESMARIEATCYREIQTRGGTYPTQIHTAGGGAQNAIWTQIRAKTIGVKMAPPEHSEASIGAARLCSKIG